MTRNEFVKLSSLFGLSLPFQSLLTSCTTTKETDFKGKVLIIGAGVAGMSAAYFLQQQNIDFEIIEAQATHGGRVKRNSNFADFPIPLGAEWLHVNPSRLDDIVNDDLVTIDIEFAEYSRSDSYATWQNGELEIGKMGTENDLKFINSTWFDFYNDYIYPYISAKIKFNTQINSIDYSSDTIVLTDIEENTYNCDKVIITVPLKMLQLGKLSFSPDLPDVKKSTIESAKVWGGIKVFFEFTEAFYPTYVSLPSKNNDESQFLYYDASFGQTSNKNILGVFAVGEAADKLTNMSNEEIKNELLSELDEIFDGKASATFIKYLVQNWTKEPFFQSAYISDNSKSSTLYDLGQSVSDKLFFAGEAYTDGSDWGGAHAAADAAKRAVEEILEIKI
ncbi:MAG: flavin monoamine oxidase family protein [Bacteroidia bacterium]